MKSLVKVIQMLISGILLYLLLINSDGPVELFYYKNSMFTLFPVVVCAFIVLSVIAPKKWAMSINRFKEANFIERVSPLIFSIGVAWLFSQLTQTYAVVLVTSFFVGNSIAYVGWVLSYTISPKIFKFVK